MKVVTQLNPDPPSFLAACLYQVHSFLDKAGVHAFFSLSWIITWFAHDIYDLSTVARLFDVFLCSPPSFPLYMSAAIVLHRKAELLETDCDFALVHDLLAHIPAGLPYDQLVREALSMSRTLPPDKLLKLGDRSLPSLIAGGQVVSFKHPPAWYQRHVPADWVMLENRDDSKGKNGARLRLRRRKAAKAGAKLPMKGGEGGSNSIRRLTLPVGSTTIFSLVGFTALALACMYGMGTPQSASGGFTLPPTRRLTQPGLGNLT